GHENRSPFNRINQRGPEQMGWRTNSRNQNLNRDYAKLDTPGVRAVVQVINDWKPDLYLDLHVTDGADYQYDITFGGNGAGGWSPTIAAWIDGPYTQHLNRRLSEMGHIPGPLILVTNNRDTRDGYYLWTADPRYSNAYGDARHLPTILVENHSLKPYRQRVLGTYVLLEASLEALALNHEAVVDAVIQDRQRRSETVVLGFQPEEKPRPPEPFRGIRFETYQGAASGGPVTRWTGEADDTPVSPVAITRPRAQVAMPEAYLVPAQWPEVAERLALHGIPVEQLSEATTFDVEVYRLPGAKLAEPAAWTPNPFEGRVRIDPGVPEISRRTMTFPAGSYRIPTDHALGELAALLLEPLAADSFLQWGFFLEMFTRTEYAEPYVIEPLAQQMLEQDPELAREFEALLAADSEFASDPVRRLLWFYERTPFFDPGYRVYPVARLAKP
ncbi:MAG: hypothetical protein R3348_06630, partial [Xanthomonadales bacterium]|nr:hypothetical protein [Xanthomonadales bacterium]